MIRLPLSFMMKMKIKRSNLDLVGTGYCAWFNLRRAARSVTGVYDDALKPTGLRSSGFTLLATVAESEPISVGDLAEALFLDPTTMTRNLQVLRRHGLLSVSLRSSVRKRFVTLLPKGRKALARSLPLWRRAQRKFVNKVGQKSWRAWQKELERISTLANEVRLELSKKQSLSGLS